MSAMAFDWDFILFIAGAVMTLAILSYLLSDNVLYRWALALLVGAGTGFAFGAAMHFLFTWVMEGWQQHDLVGQIIYGVPVLLGVLLLFKSVPRLSVLGNLSMGLLLGVGAAVAFSGALLGTMLPQVLALSTFPVGGGWEVWGNAALILVGTLAALFVFSPIAERDPMEDRPRPLVVWLRRIGRGFIAVALAVAFAGALTTALTLMVDRLWALADFFSKLLVLLGG